MATYTYPRVSISTTALTHSSVASDAADTTVLFVPIIARKGAYNQIVKIHSLEEFINEFGTLQDTYKMLGVRTTYNISNWLTAGGTIYVYRAVNANVTSPKVVSKSGSIYISTTGTTALTNPTFNIILTVNGLNETIEDYDVQLKIDEVYTPASSSSSGASGESTGTTTSVTQSTSGTTISIRVKSGNTILETFTVSQSSCWNTELSLSSKSEYFSSIKIYAASSSTTGSSTTTQLINKTDSAAIRSILGKESSWTDMEYDADYDNGVEDLLTANVGESSKEYGNYYATEFLPYFWEVADATITNASNSTDIPTYMDALGNPLETQIDLLLDAGYPTKVKSAMTNVVTSLDNNGSLRDDDNIGARTDIRLILDLYTAYPETTTTTDTGDTSTTTESDYSAIENALKFDTDRSFPKDTTYALYVQKFIINDDIYTDSQITVGPSYFLSSLIPASDITNGIQYPVAGTRRAELDGVVSMSENPMPSQKEKLFNARINYAERDSRGYYFMSQRTHDGSTQEAYTALSFLNNSRVLCRMVHEIESLARDYLFEFNDSITLANLSSVLNKYVTTWISNRTLSYGNVAVSQNAYSEEAVDVQLNIKFTGTVEVISVDIIIE